MSICIDSFYYARIYRRQLKLKTGNDKKKNSLLLDCLNTLKERRKLDSTINIKWVVSFGHLDTVNNWAY